MHDEVKVTFVDMTTTIIYVDEDDSIQDILAQIADEEGIAVYDYKILSGTDDRQELH